MAMDWMVCGMVIWQVPGQCETPFKGELELPFLHCSDMS